MASFTHHSTNICGVPTRHFGKHWGYKLPEADKICPHEVYVLVEKTENKGVNTLVNADSNVCQLDSKKGTVIEHNHIGEVKSELSVR